MAARNASSPQIHARSTKTRHKRQTDVRRKKDCNATETTKTASKSERQNTAADLRNSSVPGKRANPNKMEQNTIRTKTTFVKEMVRETLCEYDESFVPSKDSYLESRNNRVFLGECQYEEGLECSRSQLGSFGRRRNRASALTKFRKVVKYVMTAQRMFRSSVGNRPGLSKEDTMFLYIGLPETVPQSESDRPLFDLTPFKSIGEKNFSLSLKSILEIQHTERTEHQVNTMVHMLRTFAKFSSYPPHVQRGICKQGWYARFESAKVICKEGNPAEYYYLILSGVAISHCTEEDKLRGKTTRVLRRGDTIGEKEILTQSERDATIISRDPIEVLGIDGSELFNIFRSAGTLDHLDFLRSIPDIQLFPMELLQAYDFSCSAHYYRRGAVIVKDSNEAEWIYIVKTGSCQVYKAIKLSEEGEERRSEGFPSTRREDEVILPSINPALQRVVDLERSLTYDNIHLKRTTHPLKTSSSSYIELPSIKPGQVSMVSSDNDWLNDRLEGGKSQSARHKKRRSAKGQQTTDGKKSVYYAKLDIVTEQECFGLQSLLYDDMPGLSLVSNGAECILISKQFFKDNLTSSTINHLKCQVPPYPNLGNLQDALSRQVKWGSYKRHRTMTGQNNS